MYPYFTITLPSYGVMAFIGGFVVLLFLFFRLDKYDISFFDLLKLFAVAIVGGILGSKVLYAITQIPWLIDNFTWENLLMFIPMSGFVFYGGLFGVLIFVWLMTKKDKEKQDRVFKLIIPAIPLFHGFGRIGCMLAGCCYGIELDDYWQLGFVEFDRVPVQLIEACFEFALFVVFIILESRKSKLYDIKSYLVLYSIFRFIIEFFRGDEARGIWVFGLSTSQMISIIVFVIVFIVVLKNKKTGRCNNN